MVKTKRFINGTNPPHNMIRKIVEPILYVTLIAGAGLAMLKGLEHAVTYNRINYLGNGEVSVARSSIDSPNFIMLDGSDGQGLDGKADSIFLPKPLYGVNCEVPAGYSTREQLDPCQQDIVDVLLNEVYEINGVEIGGK